MPHPFAQLALLLVLLAPTARAQVFSPSSGPDSEAAAAGPTAPSSKEEAPLRVAVLAFEANASARDSATGVTSLITGRLAEAPRLWVVSQRDVEASLDDAQRRQLADLKTSCERGACLKDLSTLTGARFVVIGRVDRFGDSYLLSANLLDTEREESLSKPRAESPEADTLFPTVYAIADALVAELVAPGVTQGARPLIGGAPMVGGGGLSLGLRINNNFVDKLANFNPGADLEVGYWFHPEWLGFVQVGFSYLRSDTAGAEGGLNVLPSVVGARHYHNVEKSLRPYWGFGLGVQLSFGDFGIFQSTGPLPTVVGFLGLEYLIAGHVGVQLEAGTNVAQAVLGLAESKLGDGLNLDLNLGIAYHF
ncbi:hypothetical protein HUA74_18815 [Myxococcus sp. CA051A]|uniref:hypothetical protein n=1 Tax=unclassified Myxococcus TaxID=2648731 RepID=UPI00157A303D|nr:MULTISPECIES: hypothetical protein [unclassified Myxococcus]NTX01905.1 hypothetical protein [Myxococcus sp. CA040A]NTX38733.1 hypothetical protein [Myxococcus sp. CA033]NTX57447.1 hypothetical protein [Myxococcus sp. CA039A]NTX14607.1 hypothetical protein [Myxococcus sp. CA056]NTX62702.1 hypothetical protein [Myxococcus sp. CA051A]